MMPKNIAETLNKLEYDKDMMKIEGVFVRMKRKKQVIFILNFVLHFVLHFFKVFVNRIAYLL